MSQQPGTDYQAFLLRLWRDGPERPWRASLLDPHTEQTRYFGSVEELTDYLTQWSGQTAPASGSKKNPLGRP